jgi:hypothetical protein
MKLFAIPVALLLATLVLAAPAQAGGDHDHDHDHGPAAAAPAGPALPRFAAESETFELVGVLEGLRITLYLDRYADNSPVPGAQIELDINGQKLKAAPQADGAYEIVLPQAPKAGVLPITASVAVGNEADLLASELDIPAPAAADDHAHPVAWAAYAGWGAAGLVALAWLLRSRLAVRAARRVQAGGAA